MTKGKIGVSTQDLFPIIKKFLYSDHEIFLRELVSNAVDATQKLKTLLRRACSRAAPRACGSRSRLTKRQAL